MRYRFALLLLSLFLVGCNNQTSTYPQSSPQSNQMQQPSSGPVNYVALGDSTGVGVGATNGGYVARLFKRIEQHRPGSKLLNLCVSGATSEDVQLRQLDRGIQAKPTLVTLGIGINDLGHGFSVDTAATNIDRIVARLKNETQAQIVISNLPDISHAPAIPRPLRAEVQNRIEQLNQRISEVGARHGVKVFDIYSSTHELLADHPEYFSRDGFHPSDAGYEVWAEQMWPSIAQAVGIQHP
jgi:acyl-CoA thioesterase I